MKFRSIAIVALLVALLAGSAAVWFGQSSPRPSSAQLKLSVPPFVDTAMTVLGDRYGIFEKNKLDIEFVATPWERQYELVAGNALDISMSTVDEFANKDRNLSAAGRGVVYVLPAWQFKGLGFYTSDNFKTLADLEATDGENARAKFAEQLVGRRIAVPEGSAFESAIKQFIADSGIASDTVEIVNAPLEAALNSLSDPQVVLAAVGSQQRFEAERRAYREAISPEQLGLDIITGFVVRKEIWETRRADVIQFGCSWYEIVRRMKASDDQGYAELNAYLSSAGAGSLTPEEYADLRKYNVFADTPADAEALFFQASGPAYWRRIWDRTVTAMNVAGRSDEAPETDAGFVAPALNAELMQSCPK